MAADITILHPHSNGADATCPYCGYVNRHCFTVAVEDDYPPPEIVACGNDDGDGCSRYFSAWPSTDGRRTLFVAPIPEPPEIIDYFGV